MYLSIISVIKAPADGFAETFLSVLQEFEDAEDAEYIIKEAANGKEEEITDLISRMAVDSKVGDKEISLPIRHVESRDRGVFDGMNQGVKIAHGEYVVFLNAGDWFAKGFASALRQNIERYPDSDFFYFDGYTVDHLDRREFLRKSPDAPSIGSFFRNSPILHPCLVVKRAILEEHPFDLKYDLAADYDLAIRLVSGDFRGRRIPVPGAYVLSGGISEQSILKSRIQGLCAAFKHAKSLGQKLTVIFSFIRYCFRYLLIRQVIHRIPLLRRFLIILRGKMRLLVSRNVVI